MKRVLFAVVSTIAGLVMLLSFKTQATTVVAAPAGVTATGPGTAGGSTGAASTAPSATSSGGTSSADTASSGATAVPSATPSSAAASTSRTVTGAAASTRYGPVQVRITVTNGTVTSVEAVEYPQENPRDAEINASAIPQLNQEATAARSANIDTVSGATYTSDGYIQSLQNALNQAGL